MLLTEKIFEEIKRDFSNVEAYEDMFGHLKNIEGEHFDFAHKKNKELKYEVQRNLQVDVPRMFDLYRRCLLFDAPYDFDSYLLYLEIDRPPEQRFYLPRRKRLRKAVKYIQMLVDDELDELFLSMPPRVGKSTLLMFLMTWIMGRSPDGHNLYSAYSDVITRAFYNGVLEVIQDTDTYKWIDVFPLAKLSHTNSAEETIDINKRRRYHSLTCRSLYGTLNGACDCDSFLISDDLIGSIEEAMNKDRLINSWAKVDNNLIPRAKEKAKILWCGTRWSIADPIGIRNDLLANSDAYKNRRFAVINLPALDENDESLFEYDYNVGFSTDFYRQRRASFEKNNDLASWSAQYMGEPIEREGTLFAPQDFRYFNGVLPPTEPDAVFMAVDPAWGGGDYVASPVCVQYDDEIYVVDVVYDNNDKRITQPLIVAQIEKYAVSRVQFEANKMTEAYKEDIDKSLKEKGLRVNIMSKPAQSNKAKEQRIFDKAPEIREHFLFLESGHRSKAYDLFMQNVYSFKMYGKNEHDDAPDSLAMACDVAFGKDRRAEVFRRFL